MHLQARRRQAAPGRPGDRRPPVSPKANSGRIPIVGITGTHGKTAVARAGRPACSICPASASGWPAATACISTGARSRRQTPPTGTAGHRLLMNRAVEAAVIENGAAHDPRRRPGLRPLPGRRRHQYRSSCREPGALGRASERRRVLHDCRNVLRTQVDVVLPDGYCGAQCRRSESSPSLAELSDGEVIFFAADPACPAMAAHIAAGGRGVFVRDGRIMLASRQRRNPSLPPRRRAGASAGRRIRPPSPTCWPPSPPAGRWA